MTGYEASEQRDGISGVPEKELILRCQKGENAAMEEMLNRYKNMVRSKATALYLVGADKEDLIQEGMIGLFKAICEYKPEKNESFSAFAGLCVSRQMYTAIKYSNTKKNQPLNNYVSIDLVEGEEEVRYSKTVSKKYEGVDYWQKNPENSVIDRERSVQLLEEVEANLSGMERQVLAYYAAGFPYQQIAQLMGKEPKSIDNALQRIRKKLKTVLAISPRM